MLFVVIIIDYGYFIGDCPLSIDFIALLEAVTMLSNFIFLQAEDNFPKFVVKQPIKPRENKFSKKIIHFH